MLFGHRIESATPLLDGKRMKIAFKKPKCAFTLDITGMMDGSDDFTRLQDPKVFKRVKVVHYGGGLQWGGDEMLEVGADTLFRMAEAQNRMTVKEAKKTMKELNLSQAEAARILDVDTRTFERMLEKGEPLKRPYTALMRAVRDDPNLLSAFHRPSRPAGRPKARSGSRTLPASGPLPSLAPALWAAHNA